MTISLAAAFFSLVLLSGEPRSLDALSSHFAERYESGDLDGLMELWSPSAPARAADRRRLARLLEERVETDLEILETSEERAEIRFEIRRTGPQPLLLEEYSLALAAGDDGWRIVSLTSSESHRIATLDDSVPAPSVPLVRELLHRGIGHLVGGDVAGAAPLLTLAEKLGERTGDPRTFAAALRAAGRLDSARADFGSAAVRFQKSLQIAEAAADRGSVARALGALANVDRVRGDLRQAEERMLAALEIFEQLDDTTARAHMLSNLGGLRSMQARYAEATANLEESLRFYVATNDSEGRSIVLNNLGIIYRLQGSYDLAQTAFEEALLLSRQNDDLEGIASALGNLGNVHTGLGNFMQALDAYQQSLRLNEQLGIPPAIAGALAGMAGVYTTLGSYPLAIDALERAYTLAEKAGFKEGMAFTLHNIGSVFSRQGDIRRGLQYYERSLAIETEIGNRIDMAVNLADIGKSHALLGDAEQARRSYERALEIAKEIEDRETMVLALIHLTELSEKGVDADDALRFGEEAVAIAGELALPHLMQEAHLALGRLHRRRGRLDPAKVQIERSIALVEEIRRGIPGEQIAQRAFESRVVAYQEIVALLLAQNDPQGAFHYAERAKGRVLLDVVRHGRSDPRGVMTEAERARERQLIAEIVRLNRDLHRRPSSGEPDRAALRNARREYDAFVTGLYVVHPELRAARGEISPLLHSDVAALFDSRIADAFVEFVVTEEATHVFAVTPAGLWAHTLPIARKALAERVKRFRDSLAARELDYADDARALFDQLLRPVDAQIRGAKRLGIIPDGPLWELPFQALQPAAGRFLLDRHALFYAPSITILRETAARAKPPDRGATLLAVGNPLLSSGLIARHRDAYRDVSLDPLPHAEREARRIADLYRPKETLYVGTAAREEVIKRDAGRFGILHFATHGLLDDESPLHSRLLLSQPLDEHDDGLLEAREIMSLDLTADLAVMSACETGRGRVGAGEGLIGMSWAFFVAGCPATVVSQWKVSSAGTAELMIEFHRQLRAKGGARASAEALRGAALELRRRSEWRHPFYWAPFVLVGIAQ